MRLAELSAHAAVVAAALALFAVRGARFSSQFAQGGKFDGAAPGLRPGVFGRSVDLSDFQWREFRGGMPAMAALFCAAAAASRALRGRVGTTPAARARLSLLVALPFLGYLHGACAAFVLGLALLSFGVAQAAAGRKHGTAVIWACNLGMLLAARLGNGFQFARMGQLLAPLDGHRGVMRWEICFNLTVLRMLSYALDLHWQRQHLAAGSGRARLAKSAGRAAGPSAERRWRQQEALPGRESYGLLFYLAHALYAPLYLAGPVITYQDFVWQLRQASPPTSAQVARHALRFAADWLCLELVTHFLYFNSIAKHRVGLSYRRFGLAYGHTEMAMTAFWVLCFMWLKFATIWRFFRLAALLEGVDPPENMRRCFANNYDLEGFWRGWHSSFNQWLVRYMYVPMGGSRRRALLVWPIFFFVAVWHDLEWRLLSWAWLICFAFVPELGVKHVVRSPRLDAHRQTTWFRCVCAAGAAVNIAAMMAVNLAGFVVGLDGLKELLPDLLSDWVFVVCMFTTFFSAANLQFQSRASECYS